MPRITKDYVENFGVVPTSPWISGEQSHRTSAVLSQASSKTSIPGPQNTTYSEPSIMSPSRSMNTVVFHAKNGGNSVVVNDEGGDSPGYMLITHNSGSVVQIDSDGTVLIKSTGDTHNNTDGLHYQRSEGDSNLSVGGEWNVVVEGGSGTVYIQGDLNIECENFNVTARGKSTINAGEAVEIKGARISAEAHSDNVDLVGKNVKVASSEKTSILSNQSLHLTSQQAINLNSLSDIILDGNSIDGRSATNVAFSALDGNIEHSASEQIVVGSNGELKMSGSTVKIYGGTTYIDDIVRMAEGGASETNPTQAKQGEQGILPSPSQLPDPPPRRPSLDTRNRVSTVFPRNGPVSSTTPDDTT